MDKMQELNSVGNQIIIFAKLTPKIFILNVYE